MQPSFLFQLTRNILEYVSYDGIYDSESRSMYRMKGRPSGRVYGSAEKLNIHVACGGRNVRAGRLKIS